MLLCSVLVHVNPKHSLVGLPEALDECKQDVAQLVAKVEKSKTELNNALSATEKSRKKLDSMFADTNKKNLQKGWQGGYQDQRGGAETEARGRKDL